MIKREAGYTKAGEEKKDESGDKPSALVTAKKQAPVANNNTRGKPKTVSHTVCMD